MKILKRQLLLAILLIGACNPNDSDKNDFALPGTSCNDSYTIVTSDLENQIQATTDFAFDLFRKSAELESGNLLQSPVSIYSVLLMIYEGADCETKAQIAQALNLGEAISTFPSTSESYSNYLDWLNDGSDAYSLKMANALFSDPKRISLLEDYKNKVNTSYDAELGEFDFSNPASLNTINQWGADNTEGKIEEVLDGINGTDVAFLMNALYFKSDWEIGFDPEETFDADFTKKDGAVINIPFMKRHSYTFVHQGETLDMVELPLKDNQYIVNLFVPADKNISIDQIIQKENFQEIFIHSVESCQEGDFTIHLPQFELTGKQKLQTALGELGMIDLFSESDANLHTMGTGIGRKLYLSRVLHDTYIKFDEKGIEGAAITIGGVAYQSASLEINFDRPFAFVIRKADSYAPLFIGKVENPL